MNRFYVYVYLNPSKPGKYKYGEYEFDYEPFYVGKGTNQRYKYHLKSAKKGEIESNLYFSNTIKYIIREYKQDPLIIKYKTNLEEKESFCLEMDMIKTIGRKDLGKGPLTNLTNGGEGMSGWKMPEEVKEKTKHVGKNNYWYEKTTPIYKKYSCTFYNEEIKNRAIKKLKKVKHTKEWNDKVSKSLKGRTLSDDHKNKISKIRRKKWIIITPENKKFEINGLLNFCRENNLCNVSMSNVADGKQDNHRGYKCERKE